jgi:hypothetical protein
MEITYVKAGKLYIANVPTGRIIISRVPGTGLMAVHRPTGKFSGGQVIASPGKYRTVADVKAGAVREYDALMGVDDIRRPVYV